MWHESRLLALNSLQDGYMDTPIAIPWQFV